MFGRILLCYDGTLEGRRALRQGAEVAYAMKATAFLLAICRDRSANAAPESATPELFGSEQRMAQALLDEGVHILREHGIAAEGEIAFGDPQVLIPLVATRIHADLIVIGHRQRGRLSRWWSEGQEVTLLHKVPCSIMVAIPPPSEP
jgi:nucleotide-binding universal stress UspA family protein